MKIAVLTANLGEFDTPIDPIAQKFPDGVESMMFHRWTDDDFPPIIGLTPRLQYRIPKMFGWEMFPDYDIYIWLDGSMSLPRTDSCQWFLDKLGDADIACFKHPWRKNIEEEVNHIEEYLQKGNDYITSRYKNGLHKEQFAEIKKDTEYKDDRLYASTSFIYRNNTQMRKTMRLWWFYQSRYFTCDQVVLPYVLDKERVKVNMIEDNLFKSEYISLVSHHK